jgi:hypothetical protein
MQVHCSVEVARYGGTRISAVQFEILNVVDVAHQAFALHQVAVVVIKQVR